MAIVPFEATLFHLLVSAMTFAAISNCWGERPQNYAPQSQPIAASPAFVIATIAIVLHIGHMAYVFVYQPRKATAQTDLSALYGYRMVNRRGESGLQSDSYFSYTENIHLTCLPKSISPLVAEVQAIWQGPRPIPQNNHLQITLSRDNWGPGYYRDLVPALSTK